MKRILLLLTVALSTLAANAQVDEVKTRIYFKQDKSNYEAFFRNNLDMMKELQRTLILHEVDSITVIGSASIEGYERRNITLGKERAESVKAEIAKFDDVIVNTTSFGEDWEDFIRLVSQTDLVDKAEILAIANRTDISNDQKERLMMSHKESWKYIEEYILPNQRAGVSFVIYYKEPIGRDTVIIREIHQQQYDYRLDTVTKPLFAIKTNMLYNLATALNIELEVPMGRHWSLAAGVVAPWWGTAATNFTDDARSTFKMAVGNLEARFWLRSHEKKMFSGLFIGAYVNAGIYDLEKDFKGYMGDFYGAGLSLGFSHRAFNSDNFRIEYSASFGHIDTQYNYYTRVKSEYLGSDAIAWVPFYQYTDNLKYLGLTELSISLSWIINKRTVRLVKY